MVHKSVEINVGPGCIRGSALMPAAEGKFPTIVFMHGFTVDITGPNRFHLHFARRAVEAGFCCIRFDFYGCGESDGDFYEMKVSTEMRDAIAIMNWAKEQPYVDAENLFLGGHSMGGLVTTLTIPTIQPKAAFAWSAALNMPLEAGKRARTMKGPSPHGWDIEGLELSKEYMDEIYGMNFLDMIKGYSNPILLVHGTADEPCPVENAFILKAAYGDNAEVHTIAGADHRMLSIGWREDCYAATINFLKKQIG